MVSFFDIRMKGVVMTVKDPLRFDGVDVKFTKVAGVGVAVVTALLAIVWPIVTWVRGEPLVVWFDGAAEGAAEGVVPGAALPSQGYADLCPGHVPCHVLGGFSVVCMENLAGLPR